MRARIGDFEVRWWHALIAALVAVLLLATGIVTIQLIIEAIQGS